MKKSRRDFLKQAGGGMLWMAGGMSLPLELQANDGSSFSDYKAIVIVNLYGGNDGINTFVPIGDDPLKGYDKYKAARAFLAVDKVDLGAELKQCMQPDGTLRFDLTNKVAANSIYNLNATKDIATNYTSGYYGHDKGYDASGNPLNLNFANSIGTHAYMPEIAHWLNRGRVAVVANVGNLIRPTTRADILNNTAELPPFLMAHDHQTTLVSNGNAKKLREFGWAGRLYDKWSSVNLGSPYDMNIGINTNAPILYGKETTPTIMGTNGMTPYHTFGMLPLFTDSLNYPRSNEFRRLYNDLRKRAYGLVDRVSTDLQDDPFAAYTDMYGNELFANVTQVDAYMTHGGPGKLVEGCETIAKLAKAGKDSGMKRQIFYYSVGGYDTHGGQARGHGDALRMLSIGLGKMQQAFEHIGMADEVTIMTTSEFGRSVGTSGDGSNHAWGSHLFVMGGAVKGGLYGDLPSLELGGEDDMTEKGRLIPKISMAQYHNTVLKWFGADEALRQELFPEIVNFDPSVQDLGFMG